MKNVLMNRPPLHIRATGERSQDKGKTVQGREIDGSTDQ